jgi:hypothetical protein
MNTTENNKLIQNFYDGTLHPMVEKGHIRGLNGLDYHTSWDWLMPVVEKIEEITQRMFDCRKHKQYYSVRISIQKNIFADKSFMGFSINKKDAYYEAVVEFIKWHNENK